MTLALSLTRAVILYRYIRTYISIKAKYRNLRLFVHIKRTLRIMRCVLNND